MKGQVFLLTAAIIIAVLVTLRAYSSIQHITSEREILDISQEELAFKNVQNEVNELIDFSSNTPSLISTNSIDFLNFTRTGESSHAFDFRSMFVGVLANSTNQTMNITLFQLLRETSLNVTINLSTSPVQTNSTLLNDGGIWINNFTYTAGQTYNLTLNFPTKNYIQNITIKTKNKDTYTGFYNLTVISDRAVHTNVLQETVKVS